MAEPLDVSTTGPLLDAGIRCDVGAPAAAHSAMLLSRLRSFARLRR